MAVFKKTAATLVGVALFLLSPSKSPAGETSERASANGVGFHLTSLHVVPTTGTEQWIVSGFAPGIG